MNEETRTLHRDEELGEVVRALEVPEHRPGFYEELERLLGHRGGSGTTRGRRLARRTLSIATTTAVVVASVIGAVELVGADRAPEVASAAEVKARVLTSLTSLDTLSGTLVSDGPRRGDVRRWRFALTTTGDVRLAGPTEDELITYDASSGVVRSAQRSASLGEGPLLYAERRGVAPGPPDAGAPALTPLDELGAYVRALFGAGDPFVREVAYEGRPAWRLEVDAVPNAIVPELSGDRLEITIDRGTAMPVRVVERRRGTFLREIRIGGLRVDGRLAAGTFRPELPAGAEVMRSNSGFQRVRLDDVAHVVGYRPLVPGWAPAGYELAEVAVAREAGPTGTEAGNPPSRMVVSLSYRRGFDQFLVTTRLAKGPAGRSWSDPLATGEGFVDRPEPVVLSAGAFRGVRADLVLAPRGIPHLWTLTDQLVGTVGGDLDRAELIHVAESLEPWRR